ncbi:MAG: thioredoxin [FCB group bacterium]|nr:thioredoxin [FCB group bacterium]
MFGFGKKKTVNTHEFTDATWSEKINAESGFVLVDVWAPWCGPCKLIGPIVDELAAEYSGRVTFGKINADHNQKPRDFKVRGIPTLLFFKNGKLIDRIVGAKPKNQISAMLDKHIPPAASA